MSLDVYIEAVRKTTVFDRNITHNLGEMANEAGVRDAMWEPEKLGITTAGQLIPILEKGLADLKARPDYFKTFNPSNGWGTYGGLVSFVEEYLAACQENPDGIITVGR